MKCGGGGGEAIMPRPRGGAYGDPRRDGGEPQLGDERGGGEARGVARYGGWAGAGVDTESAGPPAQMLSRLA